MKDWGTYRKLYETLDPDFEQLPYLARAVAGEILRRCDRKGRIVRGERPDDRVFEHFAFHLRSHPHEKEMLRSVFEILTDASTEENPPYLVFRDGWLTVRNFIEAQRTESADRMAKKRERDAQGEPGSLDPDPSPKARDESDASDVTTEQPVTLHAGASSRLVSSGLVSDLDPEKLGTSQKLGSVRARPEPPAAMHRDWLPPRPDFEAQMARWQATEQDLLATLPEFREFWIRDGGKKSPPGWIRCWLNRLSQLAKRGELWLDALRSGGRGAPNHQPRSGPRGQEPVQPSHGYDPFAKHSKAAP